MIFFAGVCFGMLVVFLGQVVSCTTVQWQNRRGVKPSDTGGAVADEETVRLANRRKREIENFLNYNGDRMPDPE